MIMLKLCAICLVINGLNTLLNDGGTFGWTIEFYSSSTGSNNRSCSHYSLVSLRVILTPPYLSCKEYIKPNYLVRRAVLFRYSTIKWNLDAITARNEGSKRWFCETIKPRELNRPIDLHFRTALVSHLLF